MSDNPRKNLNCGSCSGLVRERVLEERCATLGRLPSSKACGSHLPDVFSLVGDEDKVQNLEDVSELMAQMSVNDLQILGSLMLREKNTRKNGFQFRQKVYVRFRGDSTANYMSNFVVGYVLDATKETIRVIGESGKTTIMAINDSNSESVYTVPRFNKLRQQMLAEGRRVDPSIQSEQQHLEMKQKYTSILPLDEAVEKGIVPKKSKSARDDLVSMVSRLGRGQLKRKDKDGPSVPGKSVRIDYSGA